MGKNKVVLETLLVVVCIVSVSWSLNHERDSQFLKRNRRIALSEYLVPPPPPRNHAPARTGRYVSPQLPPPPPPPPQPQLQESQGYLSRLMGWLNPFSSTPPSYGPPLPPPPPKHPPLQHPHPPQPYPPYPIYPPLTDPRPGGPLGPYNGPSQPPPYLKQPPPNNFNNYHKPKNCNACNKVPWVPMQNTDYFRKEPSYDGHHNQWNQNRPIEVPYDNHHAPSEEVRAPDFAQPQFAQNGQPGPLPNPQLYPGPMPPLYKAGVFAASGPSAIGGNNFQQQASLSSEVIISTNSYPQVEHGWTQAQQQDQYLRKHNDLAASGTQVDQDQSKIEDPNYHDPVPSSGFGNVLDYVSHDLGPSGSHEAFHFDNTHSNLPLSTNTEPPPTISSQIHYEQSPLLDLTKNDDSQGNVEQIPPSNSPHIKLEQFSGDFATVTANYYAGNENDLHQSQLESTGTTASYISADRDALGLASSLIDADFSPTDTKTHERTALSSLVGGRQDNFYIPPSGQEEEHSSTGLVDKLLRNDSADSRSPRTGSEYTGQGASSSAKGANGVTRSKQVQVIIPYTSQYTPLPFQPSFNDWNINYNVERTQPRKVPPLIEPNTDKYVGQESRPASNRANGTIDVHRLQKNIDNWTIQEYSRATTASTFLPSSLHPHLLPSKTIPDEYLTTTESVDQKDKHDGSNEIVKVYSLGGFSFNDVEHEGSASDHVEQTVKLNNGPQNGEWSNSSKVTQDNEDAVPKVYPATSDEQVYVVTPLPVRITTQALSRGHSKYESKGDATKKATTIDLKKSKGSLDKFEAIERAYQVLPQAVNSLAIASTGKEDVPLWGIMEHEEFAALHHTDDEHFDKDIADGPVLYSGHSKVSHARRR